MCSLLPFVPDMPIQYRRCRDIRTTAHTIACAISVPAIRKQKPCRITPRRLELLPPGWRRQLAVDENITLSLNEGGTGSLSGRDIPVPIAAGQLADLDLGTNVAWSYQTKCY